MDFLNTIGNAIFGWCMPNDVAVLEKLGVFPWAVIFLLVVSLCAALCYYYGISAIAANATKRNYIIVTLLGLLVLWLVNLVIIPTIIDEWDYAFELPNILLSLVDSVYYLILLEIFSLFIKDTSNAKHIHLLNCLS